MPKQNERSNSVLLITRRADGIERVHKRGGKDPATCNHAGGRAFISHKYKPDRYRERCWLCGKYREVSNEVPEEKSNGETVWTSIPQTLQRLLQVATKVEDWKNFRPLTVQRILKNEKSAAWSYYATLATILDVTQGKQNKGLYIQPETLKKLVILFEKLDNQKFVWQQVKSILECSRSTAKRYEHVLRFLNAEIPAA